jgi:predicted nucleotidyltransferase
MDDRGMGMQLQNSTSFWRSLKRGPWPEPTLGRLRQALEQASGELKDLHGVDALVLFGSYARGDYGRKSDVDLLVVVQPAELNPILRTKVVKAALDAETAHRLPMHLSAVVASGAQDLGLDLLHSVWSDGLILFGRAAVLASLQPEGLAPWVVFRFSARGLPASRQVQLSRLLRGRTRQQHGLVQPPGLLLGRGAALVPADQSARLRAAFDELGIIYDAVPVWRSVDRSDAANADDR